MRYVALIVFLFGSMVYAADAPIGQALYQVINPERGAVKMEDASVHAATKPTGELSALSQGLIRVRTPYGQFGIPRGTTEINFHLGTYAKAVKVIMRGTWGNKEWIIQRDPNREPATERAKTHLKDLFVSLDAYALDYAEVVPNDTQEVAVELVDAVPPKTFWLTFLRGKNVCWMLNLRNPSVTAGEQMNPTVRDLNNLEEYDGVCAALMRTGLTEDLARRAISSAAAKLLKLGDEERYLTVLRADSQELKTMTDLNSAALSALALKTAPTRITEWGRRISVSDGGHVYITEHRGRIFGLTENVFRFHKDGSWDYAGVASDSRKEGYISKEALLEGLLEIFSDHLSEPRSTTAPTTPRDD